ncbi:MAG TPA: class I SAM-dependent methyltransferase [Edaphobacter sp.]|nr:class I SAM-dependent methyltransferase [Edaphobacter sp.]
MRGLANFDLIARPYRTLEYLTLGRKLEQTRLHFLPRLATSRRALVLGDGDGRFLAKLLATNAAVEATAIDTSAAMLKLLRRRCNLFSNRLKTLQMDALAYTPPDDGHYDLVVSHFFLDCFTEEQLKRLIANVRPSLRGRSLWLVSDFRIPQGSLHLPAYAFVRSLYFAFRLLTGLSITHLPDHASCLAQAGFECIDRKMFFSGILTTELWELQDR